MSFNQTRDLLDHAREFHRRLGRFYAGLMDLAQSARTRELLAHLVEHEAVLDRRLGEYEEAVSDNILDTFFKYMLDGNEAHFRDYPVPDEVDAAYVIEAARHFDGVLGRFYSEMAKKALSDHVREVLLNLMEMELREQMSLSKQALELAVD